MKWYEMMIFWGNKQKWTSSYTSSFGIGYPSVLTHNHISVDDTVNYYSPVYNQPISNITCRNFLNISIQLGDFHCHLWWPEGDWSMMVVTSPTLGIIPYVADINQLLSEMILLKWFLEQTNQSFPSWNSQMAKVGVKHQNVAFEQFYITGIRSQNVRTGKVSKGSWRSQQIKISVFARK